MSDATYYSVLGVSETATQSEIKAAYRNLLKKIHPDTVSTLSPDLRRLAEDATKDITAAYSVLSDPSKRSQYDVELGKHRLGSVPSLTPPDIRRGPQVRSQTSPPASDFRSQEQVLNDEAPQSVLGGWATKHPALAILAVILVLVLVILLHFEFDR
ncbi:MAG TPA: J domain-containing protein [Candidatus Dormibacteraeota bacterium]|nr:J domain-containing protein [Candidatus Dormibacteraeota bacterium]